MLSVKLDTGFNIEVVFPISPFYRRMLAWMVDTVLMILYFALWMKLLSTMGIKKSDTADLLWLLIGFPPMFYYPAMESLTNGQTVGKRLLGIRVITLEGGQATFSQYLLRWVFRLADFPVWIFAAIFQRALPWYCSVLAFLGIACVLISNKSQRIGDMIAGTIVIFTRSKTSWQDTVFTEVEAGYRPRYPAVMRMSDKDLNSLKSIIDVVRKNGNYELAFRIAERIKWKLKMQSEEDPIDFLETLLKDYNYYTSV